MAEQPPHRAGGREESDDDGDPQIGARVNLEEKGLGFVVGPRWRSEL